MKNDCKVLDLKYWKFKFPFPEKRKDMIGVGFVCFWRGEVRVLVLDMRSIGFVIDSQVNMLASSSTKCIHVSLILLKNVNGDKIH